LEFILLDSEPDGLAPTLRLDHLLLQVVEAVAAVEQATHLSVLSHKDAALRILGLVARMDADGGDGCRKTRKVISLARKLRLVKMGANWC